MIGVLILTLTAFFLSILLVMVNYYLNKVNRRVEAVLRLLPGYNCGACGFGSCKEMARQIIYNDVDPKRCKVITDEQYNKLMLYLKKSKKYK